MIAAAADTMLAINELGRRYILESTLWNRQWVALTPATTVAVTVARQAPELKNAEE